MWKLQLVSTRRSLCSLATLLLVCLLALVGAVAASMQTIDADEYIRLHNAPPTTSKDSSNRTVLAYITPWNSEGAAMVDAHAHKIDLVSPVWYTVLVAPTNSTTPDATYILSGGPPGKTEETWLAERLYQPWPRPRIVPRFYLDGWQQKDYADLLSAPSNWHRLAELIATEVHTRNYGGVVFESAATHLLFEPISTLNSALKREDKSLTVVMQPVRTPYSIGAKVDRMQDSQNRMIVQSIPQLAAVVDFFSIMTYDMSSASGRISSFEGKDFADDSPLRGAKRGSLRQPGPNTSPRWIKQNVDLVLTATRTAFKASLNPKNDDADEEERTEARLKDPSNPFLYSDFAATEELIEDEERDELAAVRGKLLMGMPMYGYRYPLFWIDSTGQGVPVPPPSTPREAEHLHERSAPSASNRVVPFLRGPGEAVTMQGIIDTISDHTGVIVNPDQTHAEGWFDYTQIITKHDAIPGAKEGDHLYWRLYLPLPHSTRARTNALKELEDANPGLSLGVSLWELGQASPLLLNPL
ncbi:hypothetical protein PaG_01245 [Moesziomyces aphidis]|jgi:chitinase domain-containing protein 1|uniref:Chitinase n=1 Tax=Moesziomyces aphidis TaxID=84754 RepID=W3VUA8_MOEAP|nr:hypothetical protein PaG_01245 [Moesziomyces aphidis]